MRSILSQSTIAAEAGLSKNGKFKVVGIAGFEPATSRTRSVRASQLRYIPDFGSPNRN